MTKIMRFVFLVCFLLWLIAYVGLYVARLSKFDNFYSVEYSYSHYIFGIVIMAIFCVTFGICTYKNWPPSIPVVSFAAICGLMVIAFLFPPVTPVDFFLLHGKEGSPFKNCKTDCALAFEPSSYQFGLNESIDVLIIYSPADSFKECLGSGVGDLCKKMVLGLEIEQHYGMGENCDFAISRLSKANYYKLTLYGCR
ncbi:MAG: hypothetical protein ACR652_02480 [Methylocystis sp.]|uniref:hypothetical protein n=1 Tax=Methylocystis sp. TaxID=1911079 RepID=UPI003DA23F65